MKRLWVLGLTMCIAASVTTDTPQTSSPTTAAHLTETDTVALPSMAGMPSPQPTSQVWSSSATTPSTTPSSPLSMAPSSPPSAATSPPSVPTAAALYAASTAGGLSYVAGAPPPPGGELVGAVLLSTARTSATATASPLAPRSNTDSPMLNYIYDARSSSHKHMHHGQRYGPSFETNATNVVVQVGSTATIDCKINLLQDNAVSWVLRKPSEDSLRLLTVGQMTYSGDSRHSVEFLYPNNWRLVVKNVTKQDEGTYECQISTHPPKLIRTNLRVNVPEVLIVDEKGRPIQDKHYETKSTIRLSCIVRHVHMTGSVVSWIHQGVLLNQDSTRGGISVRSEFREDGAESVLNVARVDKADSGNYTCAISPNQRTTVLVHVLDGESMAELHLGNSSAPPRPHALQALLALLLQAAVLR